MNFNLDNTVIYDVESFPNLFSLDAQGLFSDFHSIWEISHYRDDRHQLFTWFNYLNQTQTPMGGFNSLHYDYPLIHWLYKNPTATVEQIYAHSQKLLDNNDRFGNQIWPRDRFAPQIDIFKIFHFDNKAKRTNLKYLQINMRSENVVESAVPFGTHLTIEQINDDVIPYNTHDTAETKRFFLHSLDAIKFRVGFINQFGLEVLNWNDTKIGENLLIDKIGRDVCFTKDQRGRRKARQTVRTSVPLRDVIFPYIHFNNPEFKRVYDYLMTQTLTPDEIVTESGEVVLGDSIKTKGVFAGLKAHVGGIEYQFGTGGIHGSVKNQHIRAGNGRRIRDIDVASLYPSIGIVNKLYPEHLGLAFVEAYAQLPKERKEWQKRKGKKCTEANGLKLAGNGAYGKSNDKFSCLLDPLYTMRITVNGQLMLAMLIEHLITVPTLQIIQANTDGITYVINEEYIPQAKEIEKRWEAFTCLVLEDAEYSDMWIADVNSYIAMPVAEPGANRVEPKLKGRYVFPDPDDWHGSISKMQPPGWHRDWGNMVSVKAAVAHMTQGIGIEDYIRFHSDKFDFMLQVKVGRADKLLLGGEQLQRNTRYYIAKDGQQMIKESPPPKGAQLGAFKRATKVSETEYARIMQEIGPGVWDERIHTKNRSVYEIRKTQIAAGYLVCECNNAANFDWNRVNYDYYIHEAKKLVVGG